MAEIGAEDWAGLQGDPAGLDGRGELVLALVALACGGGMPVLGLGVLLVEPALIAAAPPAMVPILEWSGVVVLLAMVALAPVAVGLSARLGPPRQRGDVARGLAMMGGFWGALTVGLVGLGFLVSLAIRGL